MRPGPLFLEDVPRAGLRLAGTVGFTFGLTMGITVALLLIPAWSALFAQETVLVSPNEVPKWVVDGVPDSVWMLVETSWGSDDKDVKKELLKRAETYARAASEGHPDDAGRRLAVAVVLASRTDIEGGRTQVRTAAEVHRELEAILELDPQQAGAHHLLGRLYAGVRRTNGFTRWIAQNLLGGGELKKATWQAAEEHLSYAEEHAPEVSAHHFQLAALYADTDRLALALLELEHVFPWPVVFPIERVVWNSALEAKEEWEQKLVRELEGGPDCRRRIGPNRPGRRRFACE